MYKYTRIHSLENNVEYIFLDSSSKCFNTAKCSLFFLEKTQENVLKNALYVFDPS